MNKRSGFSIVELVIVILIIGILVTIAIPSYRRSVERSKCTQALGLLNTMRKAMQQYYLDNDTYVGATLDNLGPLVSANFDNTANDWSQDWDFTFNQFVTTFEMVATRQRGEHGPAGTAGGAKFITMNERGTIGGDYPVDNP